MTPGTGVLVLGRGHISHIVKMHYFFKNLLLYHKAKVRQTKYIVMMTKDGSTKIVNFMTPRRGLYKSNSENAIFLFFFSTLGHGADKLSI